MVAPHETDHSTIRIRTISRVAAPVNPSDLANPLAKYCVPLLETSVVGSSGAVGSVAEALAALPALLGATGPDAS
jgi:hypothetical protein